jgi:hypothetical protein
MYLPKESSRAAISAFRAVIDWRTGLPLKQNAPLSAAGRDKTTVLPRR